MAWTLVWTRLLLMDPGLAQNSIVIIATWDPFPLEPSLPNVCWPEDNDPYGTVLPGCVREREKALSLSPFSLKKGWVRTRSSGRRSVGLLRSRERIKSRARGETWDGISKSTDFTLKTKRESRRKRVIALDKMWVKMGVGYRVLGL